MQTRKEPPPYSPPRRAPQINPSESSETGGVFPYLHILRNRKGLIAGVVFISLSFSVFVNLTQKPVYQASTELILQSRSKTPTLGPSSTAFFQDPTLLTTQFRLVRGPSVASKALQKLEKPGNRETLLRAFSIRPSRKRNDPKIFSEKERSALQGAIQGSVSARQPDRSMRIITISVVGYVPEMVARLADAVSEAYIEVNYSASIDAYRQNFGMISKSLAELREKIKTGELASQKINSEVQLLEALQIYGEKHPLVIELRSRIPDLARKLKLSVQNLETMEISQRKDLVPLLMRPSIDLKGLQKIEMDLNTLKPILEQEVNSNREMYRSIFQRLQQMEVEGGGSEWVYPKVVERAGVPGRPIRPNKKLNLMFGLFFGLFFGIVIAFFLEYLDSSIRSIEDVSNYLKLFPLGMVPQVQFGEKKEEGEKGPEQSAGAASTRTYWLANDSRVPLFVAEAYRIIRTNLAFGSIDNILKTLQVTSAVKGEGKTTTAANLAVSLASAGSKVLLVDADLRKPALHKILGLWAGVEGEGLSDALMNGRSWESLVIPASVPNLFFMSSGSTVPNPAELLSSKRMKSFIEELKENFDTVIFDSPPIISVADAAIIASRVEGTILVSRSGFIPRHLCLQAKNALESVHAKIIGCVLNGVQTHHQSYYSYHYYRQYGRYQEEEGQKSEEGDSSSAGVSSETLERLKALKEPFLLFLSKGWARLGKLLSWDRPNKEETKSSVGGS